MSSLRNNNSSDSLFEELPRSFRRAIEDAISFLMKEKFEEFVKNRQIFPREILRDGELASSVAELLFNDYALSMGSMDDHGVDNKLSLKIAALILQLNFEMM